MVDQVYKEHQPLTYTFAQANPVPGDWDELIRWISTEFQKIEQYAQSGVLPGQGEIILTTDLPLSLTATPQIIAPWDVGSSIPIAIIPNPAEGNLTIDKGGRGIWNFTGNVEMDVTQNRTYILHLYVNGVDVAQGVRTVAGTADQVNFGFSFFATVENGDKVELWLSSTPDAPVTITNARLSANRVG